MVEVYGLKSCDTCRKAMRALRDAGMDPVLHDVRSDPIDRKTLEDWLGIFAEALINRKSTTWRGLSDDERSEDPLDLLTAHPTLMKRPVIVAGETTHLGWTEDVRSALGIG